MDPFGGDVDDAFAVFGGTDTGGVTGQKRTRSDDAEVKEEKRPKEENITDGLLDMDTEPAVVKTEETPKSKNFDELEELALHEKKARRR